MIGGSLRPASTFILDLLRTVTALEQVPGALPPPADPQRVSRQPSLHPHPKIGPGRLDQQMEMVIQDDVAKHLPATAKGRLLQSGDQSASVCVVADDLLPGIAPRLLDFGFWNLS